MQLQAAPGTLVRLRHHKRNFMGDRERAKRRNREVGSAEKDDAHGAQCNREARSAGRGARSYGGVARCVPVAAVVVVCVACWVSLVGA